MRIRYTRDQFLSDAELLCLPETGDFTLAQVKRKRASLMKLHHPDKGGENEKAQEINEAYGRLSEWLSADKPPLKRRRVIPEVKKGTSASTNREGRRSGRSLTQTAVIAMLTALGAYIIGEWRGKRGVKRRG